MFLQTQDINSWCKSAMIVSNDPTFWSYLIPITLIKKKVYFHWEDIERMGGCYPRLSHSCLHMRIWWSFSTSWSYRPPHFVVEFFGIHKTSCHQNSSPWYLLGELTFEKILSMLLVSQQGDCNTFEGSNVNAILSMEPVGIGEVGAANLRHPQTP